MTNEEKIKRIDWKEKIVAVEDKIKSMSRKELAEFILNPEMPYCKGRDCPDDLSCEGCVIEWLGQEAEND